jgi:hypothetical protein
MRTKILIAGLLVSAAIYAQVKPLPQLKISANKQYFQTADGKPFFWLGDTGWLLFVKLDREETIQYLDIRKEQGFNVIQVMVLHDLSHAVNRYGDSALKNKNVATPAITSGHSVDKDAEYDFWDHVDFAIDEAAKRGMYMALVPVWGSNVKGGKVSVKQARSYASFLANRYKNKSNIIWLNGGDIKGSDSLNVWKAIGTTLRQHDKKHLITFHPRGRTSSSEWFHNETWLDFNMFQSGHRTYAQDTSSNEIWHYGEDNWKYADADRKMRPVKPTLDGEPSYENIPYGLHDFTLPRWKAAEVRRYAYWSVLAGGAGFTYGENSVMQFYTLTSTDGNFGANKVWKDQMTAEGARTMQYLKNLVLSKPYFERVPDQSMVLNSGERYERLAAARGKRYAFIYTYTGKAIQVQMGKIEGVNVKASWYDPSTGNKIDLGVFVNSGIKGFAPPLARRADSNDLVLVLESL